MKFILAATTAIFLATGAVAQVEICSNVAEMTHSMAEARDRGVPHSMLQDLVLEQGGSEFLEDLALKVLDAVYEMPGVSPGVLQANAYIACMESFNE